MNLIKEIEKLIYWYIPTLLISSILGFVISGRMKGLDDTALLISYGAVLSNWFIHSADNIVIAIWLYFLTKKLNEKYILWALFGLVAHIFAVVIFLVIKLLEKLDLTNLAVKN